MKPICSFQYYDKKGRRLAVFCRFISPTEAELFTLTCSHEDQFSRKYAHKVYADYLAGGDIKHEFHKPIIELVTIIPEEGEVQTLTSYCQEKYYILTLAELEVPVLLNLKHMEEIHYPSLTITF